LRVEPIVNVSGRNIRSGEERAKEQFKKQNQPEKKKIDFDLILKQVLFEKMSTNYTL
jgi:hypothetical protein